VVVPQMKNGGLQFDNLNVNCRPSVAVAAKKVIDKLVAPPVRPKVPRSRCIRIAAM